MATRHDGGGCDPRSGFVARLAWREAASALLKARRALLRHPLGSAPCRASQRELAEAVRKALVHGPFRVRLGPDGPLLPGDRPAAATAGGEGAVDLVLTDVDPAALRELVGTWASGEPLPHGLAGVTRDAGPRG